MAAKYAVIVLANTANNMAATFTTDWVFFADFDVVSFQVSSTAVATPVGAITFEETHVAGIPPTALGNKMQPPSTATATPIILTSAQTTAATVGGAVNYAFTFTQPTVGGAWVRAKYTRSSGGATDTMTINVVKKAL